jgi:N,N'-diacetyllegionaminate synthase
MSFIIAEAGVNFNGDLDKAKEMALKAKECGADAVKFQTFWDIGIRLKNYEMSREKWVLLKAYCDDIGIEFMTTAHWGSPISGFYKEDYEVLKFIDPLVKRHKVASPYLTNKRYLEAISAFGKPLIVSTGSIINENGKATITEVERGLRCISGNDITLLYCVSCYPTEKFEYRWQDIEALKIFGYPVGISDHTQLKEARPYYPVIEKHFKLDDNCLDHAVSLKPEEFKHYVESIRSIF